MSVTVEAYLPEGSGAIVVHRTLQRRMPGYRLHGHSPWLTLFPPVLYGLPRGDGALVHTTPDYGLFFARQGVPLVVTLHNYVLDSFMAPYSSALQRLHYRSDLRWFTRRSLQRADAVTAVSAATAQLLFDDLGYRGQVEIIRNGVDTNRFLPADSRESGPVRVLFSSNPGRRKGWQWLETIAAALDDGIRLVCASGLRGGVQPPRSKNIELLGSVPYERMPLLYQGMDMLLMPSVREGLSLTVLEAMSCGLPVVASEISSLPEQIDHESGGLLCPLGDCQAFAAAINRLAGDVDLRLRMGRYNRERAVRDFSEARMVDAYADLFRRVV